MGGHDHARRDGHRHHRSRSRSRRRSRSRSRSGRARRSDYRDSRHGPSRSPVDDRRSRGRHEDSHAGSSHADESDRAMRRGHAARDRERSRSRDARHRDHDRHLGDSGRGRTQRSRSPRRGSPTPDHRRTVGHAPGPPPMARPAPPQLSDTPPAIGTIHHGTVHTIRHFGIFVAIHGYRRHVLVYHEQVADDIKFSRDDDNDVRIKAMEFFHPKGTDVWVKVLSVTPDAQGDRVNGSMKLVSQTDGADLDPTGALAAAAASGGGGGGGGGQVDEPPEENSVHRATVKRIEPYGVFVALQGYRKHGLVHHSQVSNYLSFSREDTDEEKKTELAGVVAVGDAVWVKVVEVTSDDGGGRGPKIGCSIKLVDQSSGEDMDPNGLRYKPRGDGPGGPGLAAPLGSAAGTVSRTGKMDWGHLAGDNRLYVGDHTGKYKMLEEVLPPPPPGPPPPGASAAAAPAPGLPPPPPSAPRTVEEALAIIEQFNSMKREKKSKKDKKHKHKSKSSKHKKHKKHSRRADKKKRSSKHMSRSSSSSSSSSGSDSKSGMSGGSDPLLDPEKYSRASEKVLL